MKKAPFIILLLLVIVHTVQAQKAPMKYGKVDKEDLEMTVYAQDTSAAAVILCNYGYFDARTIQFVHQMRIKILKEEGKVRGDFRVPAAEKTVVKGQTVNMENGVPVITKLGKEGIFIEKVINDYYRARVAMPNVKAGSVLDIEFYYKGLPAYWSFQETIPVRWSELVLEESTYFSFRKNFSGYNTIESVAKNHWVAKSVPAFKTEPYINNVDNYLSRMNIEISSIHIPGEFYRDYATTWDAVANRLRESNTFGKELATFHLYLNSTEKEIKAAAADPEQRMMMAYEAIKKIKWNKEETIWPSSSGLGQAFSKKIGNVSDINMNLILLLRKLDIEASPVVLSTRENGLLPVFSVSFDKLNYVIVQAVIGDKTYLLDATDENLPAGMLPERTVNGRGLVIKKETQDWVDLTPQKKDRTHSMYNLKLLPDGTIKGDWKKTSYEYGALNIREYYKSFNSQDEYLRALQNENIGLSIENYVLQGVDTLEQPVKEEFTIILKNKITRASDQMFFNPIMFDRYTENPFKAEDRMFPVDFVTPLDQTQLIMLELPDGYAIEQLPKNIRMTLPENSASFQMHSGIVGNKVQVLFKLSINKPVFLQKDYQDLKIFFDELVKKQSEMLIVKKV